MRVRFALPLVVLAIVVACSSSSSSSNGNGGGSSGGLDASSGSDGSSSGSSADGATNGDGGNGASCTPVSSAPAVVLADFESGSIPNSESGATEGFRASDVARGTIVHPGANATTAAASFNYQTDTAVFYQGNKRPQYLNGSATYDGDLANAIELYVRAPVGSALLSASASTIGLWTYHWLSGDPKVGQTSGGGDLTDSQMHGYANFRLDPTSAGNFQHLVFSTSAFGQSRGNYHFYAARAVAEDQTFFGSLRQFEVVALNAITAAPNNLDLDELRLITLPPTADVCPASFSKSVPAGGGDVLVPISISNPTNAARTYRVFISSEIGVDRQTLENAMSATDDIATVDAIQGGVGADGGLGAVELFADDGSGHATGASITKSGAEISIAANATYQGVLVHHLTAGMLGTSMSIASDAQNFTVVRNTLTTSVIVWDPNAPHAGDATIVGAGSNADASHPGPPGFPAFSAPPAGWASTDVPIDQVGAYFVSVLTLQ